MGVDKERNETPNESRVYACHGEVATWQLLAARSRPLSTFVSNSAMATPQRPSANDLAAGAPVLGGEVLVSEQELLVNVSADHRQTSSAFMLRSPLSPFRTSVFSVAHCPEIGSLATQMRIWR